MAEFHAYCKFPWTAEMNLFQVYQIHRKGLTSNNVMIIFLTFQDRQSCFLRKAKLELIWRKRGRKGKEGSKWHGGAATSRSGFQKQVISL